MPLFIRQSLVLQGRIDETQTVIVSTDVANRLISAKYDAPNEPRFILVRQRWPRPVKRAADELLRHLASRGVPTTIDTIDAWIKSPIPGILSIGQECIRVEVKSRLRRKVIVVELEETIRGFEIQ